MQVQIKSMVYIADKEVLVVGDADGRVYHYDGANVGRRVRGEYHEDSPIAQLVGTADKIYSVGHDMQVIAYKFVEGGEIEWASAYKHERGLRSVAVVGGRVVVVGAKELISFDADLGAKEVKELGYEGRLVVGNGDSLFVADSAGVVHVHGLDLAEKEEFVKQQHEVTCMAISADGKVLVTGDSYR